MSHDPSTIPNHADPTKPLIMVNVHSVVKLTASNYLIWKAQLTALLIGYDLYQYIDDTLPLLPLPKIM